MSSLSRARACEAKAVLFCLLFFVFCLFFFVFCATLGVARSCGAALLMACAPCSALCARLVLCAPCLALCALCSTLRALAAVCTARAFCSVFFLHHYSDTRMYFFPLQIAAYSCWLVAVAAQVAMNAADAAALNQTLTGLGCWQSSACLTQNFNCNVDVVGCNANGSVTYMYDQRESLRSLCPCLCADESSVCFVNSTETSAPTS